ncbi:hypothetical protein SAMN06295888_1093 [Desulfonatronum zhilinae]|nr:hypothetical protein SAMN06295888_1093 [Desulfonatronum zhilinae]
MAFFFENQFGFLVHQSPRNGLILLRYASLRSKIQLRKDALRFGVAAGAAAVMTPGSELCRREDAERLYQQIRKG